MALAVKNPPAYAGDGRDTHFIPGSGRSPGGGQGSPRRYSCRRIPWTKESGGVAKCWTRLEQLSTRRHRGEAGGTCRECLCAPCPTPWSPLGLTVAWGPPPPGGGHDFHQSLTSLQTPSAPPVQGLGHRLGWDTSGPGRR